MVRLLSVILRSLGFCHSFSRRHFECQVHPPDGRQGFIRYWEPGLSGTSKAWRPSNARNLLALSTRLKRKSPDPIAGSETTSPVATSLPLQLPLCESQNQMCRHDHSSLVELWMNLHNDVNRLQDVLP